MLSSCWDWSDFRVDRKSLGGHIKGGKIAVISRAEVNERISRSAWPYEAKKESKTGGRLPPGRQEQEQSSCCYRTYRADLQGE